jgi:cold shock CspA family protein/ribosome-associated translation inhibitor RaiA
MHLPLQITARDLELSPNVEELIREEAEKLEAFDGRLTGCRVLVETAHRYPTGERVQYNVRIDLTGPGAELVVKRQPHQDLWTAIQRAFDAARRRVQDRVRRRRGDVKAHGDEAPGRGRVVRLFPYEGYGFLETADGREIYFHRNSVLRGAFARLDVGTEVRYAEEQGTRGPQASTVVLLRRGR